MPSSSCRLLRSCGWTSARVGERACLHGRTTQPDKFSPLARRRDSGATVDAAERRRGPPTAPLPPAAQLRFEESPPVVRLAEVAPGVEHLQAAVARQGEGREASGAETVHQPPTVGEVRAQRSPEQASNASAKPSPSPSSGSSSSTGRSAIRRPRRSGHAGSAPASPRRGRRALRRQARRRSAGPSRIPRWCRAAGRRSSPCRTAGRSVGRSAGHGASRSGAGRRRPAGGWHRSSCRRHAGVRPDPSPRRRRRAAARRAPAAERIVEVMQGEVVHLGLHETPAGRLDQRLSAGAAQGHCISPLSTLALSSRPSSPGRFG